MLEGIAASFSTLTLISTMCICFQLTPKYLIDIQSERSMSSTESYPVEESVKMVRFTQPVKPLRINIPRVYFPKSPYPNLNTCMEIKAER